MTEAQISFAPLTEQERRPAKAKPKATKVWQPLMPPPPDAPPPPTRHRDLGPAAQTWTYRDEEGRPLGYVCRFVPKDGGKKETRPLVFCQNANSQKAWRWQGFPEPRPLYGLDCLAARPGAPVLVTEGEKTADAAGQVFPDMVAVTSPGGSNAPAKADWSPMAGRPVFIWPDADEPGGKYGQAVARLAMQAGAGSVRVVELPEGLLKGWDLADPLPAGWDHERLRSLLESAPPWVEPVKEEAPPPSSPRDWPFRSDETGVWFRAEDSDGNLDWQKVCSPLQVLAISRNAYGEDWGLRLRIQDPDGGWHLWTMPLSLTAGTGNEYRARLNYEGLRLATGRKSKERLEQYLLNANPTGRVRCVNRTGWSEQAFVLPEDSIGDTGGEEVVFQGGAAQGHAFYASGSLADWQREVATYCQGNSRLAFAVSAAFAAPLLHLLGMEGGGFHFRGESSRGKTTSLLAAGSVWGGGQVNGFIRSWRATSNGLEAVGLAHNDCLLCLDEMSLVDSREAGEVADMLSNGTGKTRARQDGSGSPALQWRVLFLSTGEVSLADKMAEAGRRVRAGQEVRLADIPADAGAGLGIFENLHGFPSAAALADHLRLTSTKFYGTACRVFLERITTRLDGLAEAVREWVQTFLHRHCPPEADGQVKRAASRFGLVAAAGELAIALGILPWEEAMSAAGACFQAWLEQRGGTGALELSKGVAQVRRFVQENLESRFSLWSDKKAGSPTKDRVGFRKSAEDAEGGWELYIFKDSFEHVVCLGFDYHSIARELLRRGLLLPGKDGRISRLATPPGERRVRFYVLKPEILGEDDA